MNYKKYNDYELLYMVKEKDEGSQDILYQKYLPVIRNLANEFYSRYFNYGYDYEDFLQEAIVAFHRAVLAYNEDKDSLFYTFVVVCIRRSLLSFCRNVTSSRKNIANQYLFEIDNCEVADIRSDMNVIFDEFVLQSFCLETIKNLSFDEGCVFELCINGFNLNEIATLLDIPRSTVEYRIRKARKWFSKYFNKYYCK